MARISHIRPAVATRSDNDRPACDAGHGHGESPEQADAPTHGDSKVLRAASQSPAQIAAVRAARRDDRTAQGTCYCDGRGTCRSCAQRRKHAWRLVVAGGLTYAQAAERMRVTEQRVRLLVAQERDHQELKELKLNRLETESVRAFVDHELERDPWLTRAELAQRINMRQIDLDRALGYEPGKNGKVQRHVGVGVASRVVIALGRAPHELDGC